MASRKRPLKPSRGTKRVGSNALIDLLRKSRRSASSFEKSLVREKDGSLRSKFFRGVRFSPQALSHARAKFLAPKLEAKIFKAAAKGQSAEKVLSRVGDERTQQSYLRAIKKRSPTIVKKDETGKRFLLGELKAHRINTVIVRPGRVISVTVTEPSLTKIHVWRDAALWELGLRGEMPSKTLDELTPQDLLITDSATKKHFYLENDIETLQRIIRPEKPTFARSDRRHYKRRDRSPGRWRTRYEPSLGRTVRVRTVLRTTRGR